MSENRTKVVSVGVLVSREVAEALHGVEVDAERCRAAAERRLRRSWQEIEALYLNTPPSS